MFEQKADLCFFVFLPKEFPQAGLRLPNGVWY
jgi:hypothetical protein